MDTRVRLGFLAALVILAALWIIGALTLFAKPQRDLTLAGEDTRVIVSKVIVGDHERFLLYADKHWHCAVTAADYQRAKYQESWTCHWVAR